jgi:hypothetical protein
LAYSIDRAGVPWYFVDGLPSSMAVETGESGLGGFLNVDAGVAVLTTELRGVGQIGAEQSVLVRPGWITGLRFFPNFVPEQLELTDLHGDVRPFADQAFEPPR